MPAEGALAARFTRSWRRFLGKLGRAYWIERVSLALNRAHEQGLLNGWTVHEIDHRIKYAQDPGAPYPVKPAGRGASNG